MKKSTALTLMCLMTTAICALGCGTKEENQAPADTEDKVFIETESNTPSETEENIPTEAEEAPSTENMNEVTLPFEGEKVFGFSSGAGAWGTELSLEADGSFKGSYHDSDMGDMGDDYPNGTVYVCIFSGKFENISKLDDYTYSMTLGDITTEEEEGTEKIEDGFRYIYSTPYGLDGGKEFLFYTPQVPLENLSEEFLSWWPGRFSEESDTMTVLSQYGIENRETGCGFFGD